MTIKQLVKISHKIAKDKGWWSEECYNCFGKGKVSEDMKASLIILKSGKIKRKVSHKHRQYNCKYCKGTGQISIDRNNSELLMLIVTELAEACQALRKDNKKQFAEELADTVIRVADLAGGRNIDLEKEILKKIEKNKKRKFRHGKKF